jgi:hypothetical protein
MTFLFIDFPLFSAENDDNPEAGESLGFFKKLSWFIEGSVLFFPEDNGYHSDPMPILPSPGFGVSYPFTNLFRLELTFDFYMTHYGYSTELDRAVPMAQENRSARVIGILLGVQAAWYFNFTPILTGRAFIGPAADLRIVLIAAGLNDADDDAADQTDSVRKYFWSQGRWFMPVIGTGLDITVNPRFKVGLDFRVWMPAYRIWSGEDLPGIEGWRFSPGIRFTIIRK